MKEQKLTKSYYLEGIKLKEGTTLKLKEGFGQYVPDAIQKIVDILSHRLNVGIGLFPWPFEGNGFICYKALLGNDNYPITFNFKSGNLVSIGRLDSLESETIVQEIEFKNQFIVKILDELVDILERYLYDGYFAYPVEYEDLMLVESSSNIYEAGRKSSDTFEQWIDSLPKGQAETILVENRLSMVYKDAFKPWADENQTTLSNIAFFNKAKDWLEANKLENRYARKTLIINTKNKVELVDTPSEDREWKDLVANSAEGVWTDLKMAIVGLTKSAYNSIAVIGSPGVGKSRFVEKTLQEEGVEYFKVTGAIKDLKSFVKVLYDHRDNEILIFDDTNLLTTKGFREILLAALDDQPSRTISYFDSKEMNKTRNVVPNQFEFTSGVIFISNSQKADPALKSRSVVIPVFFDKEQIVDMIGQSLREFMPKIPMEIKQEVFEWLTGEIGDIKRLDFRSFKFGVGMFIAYKGDSAWKASVKRGLSI